MQVELGCFLAFFLKPSLRNGMPAKLLPMGADEQLHWFAGILLRPGDQAPEISVFDRGPTYCSPNLSQGQLKLQSTHRDVLSQAFQQLRVGKAASNCRTLDRH